MSIKILNVKSARKVYGIDMKYLWKACPHDAGEGLYLQILQQPKDWREQDRFLEAYVRLFLKAQTLQNKDKKKRG